VPKKSAGEWRRIQHLSWPRGASVNDHVAIWETHLTGYDAMSAAIQRLGRGCEGARLDVRTAFRNLPVRPQDRHLLGTQWHGLYWVDLVCPFGLRSSACLWELAGDLLVWIIRHRLHIPDCVRYVDDFEPLGRTHSQALLRVAAIRELWAYLRVPLQQEKFALEGEPATTFAFNGLQWDTVHLRVTLPPDKLGALRAAVDEWLERERCTLRELDSLVGHLSYAARMVHAGRVFYQFLLALRRRHSHHARGYAISLDAHTRADLRWWRAALASWDGRSLLLEEEWRAGPSLALATDASTWGFGIVLAAGGRTRWAYGEWSPAEHALARRAARESMPYLECRALAIAAATFGSAWAGLRVQLDTDCRAVADAFAHQRSVSAEMMDLIRAVHLIAARAGFAFRVCHVPGAQNARADALSRAQVALFRQLCPDADCSPTTPLPVPTPDW
jgi:hypothetical protein